MDRDERLALAVRAGVAAIRGEEARRRSSLIERRHRAVRELAASKQALGDAMGEYQGAVWEWGGSTERELKAAVHGALNSY